MHTFFNHFRRVVIKRCLLILSANGLALLSTIAVANNPCTPTAGGIQDNYTLSIEPFSSQFTVAKPLQLPLAIPETITVKEARFLVIIEERTANAAIPSFSDANNNALYAIAGTEADVAAARLREEGSRERASFIANCTPVLEQFMRRNNVDRKRVHYAKPGTETNFPHQGIVGQPCVVIDEPSRKVIATTYYQLQDVNAWQTERDAGKVAITITLAARGTIEDDRIATVQWTVPEEPRMRSIDVPADVPSSLIDIQMTRMRDDLMRGVIMMVAKLNQIRNNFTIYDEIRAELCRDRQDHTKMKPVPFVFLDEPQTANLVVKSTYSRVVNEALACESIDCDCNNIEAGILSGGWRSSCRGEQEGARTRCRETGERGQCHMHGPNPSWE